MAVAILAGSFGSGNPCAGSAGFGAGWRLGREQLMDPLVRDAEDGGGITHADPAAGERDGGFSGLLDGEAVGDAGLVSGFSGLLDGPARSLGQNRSGDEGDRGLVGLEPHGGGLAHPGEGLVERLAPGMGSWFFLELDRPASVASCSSRAV